ncbi:hypothetical protein [Sediminicurvatus halobius]|uniref:Uncharacterized protein n=1 Tax=Sediminicurvatus halobius TaxID=2182432 RepID=A0A2U2N8W7_9GAMM|nr:hypothetical protein [Spiribacter halobius]PWG65537.1 hypothetical protein DEM34_02015 [Spiribacter halobius]UEX76562.1 hypothetical protein LMH63_11390 [Spiribacter halobius]
MGEVHPAPIVVLLRAPADGELAEVMEALFAYSLQRAFECLERTGQPAVRRAITHRVIGPLQEGFADLREARARPARLVLPQTTVHLAERQLAALCAAAERRDFRADTVPECLQQPAQAAAKLARALGRLEPAEVEAADG